MNTPTGAVFDRELKLEELLGGLQPTQLQKLLTTLLATPVTLLDAQGTPLLADSVATNTPHIPLRWQLDIVAWLSSAAPMAQCEAATALLQQLFLANARYCMAADLHTETLLADYQKLQQQHDALQQSEARYRELSTQLEQRVAEQVQTIESSQRKLFNAEKMAAIGQLAAGVAHEINNPMGFILSNLHIAQQYVEQLQRFHATLPNGDNAELDEVLTDFSQLLRESTDGAERISAIVADLRTAVDLEHCEESLTDINQLIRTTCQLGAGKLGNGLELSLQLGELPLTCCYPGQLSQACLHVLLNATQACQAKPNGKIVITTHCDNNEIIIRITDNGCGISTAALSRVFEPFYTTHEVGQGTGLGLTVCRDIVQAHDGHIDIDSKLSKGTQVVLTLPVRPGE
jgi:signal transduction histidine kinase